MRWRAHELDGRIAAKNALKIRAALRQAANWERIFENYKRTQPAVTNNPTQDRARARAWALLNISFDNEALLAALRRTWAEAYALGILSAEDAIQQARELRKADDYIDWKNWKPGDSAAALLLKPPKGLQQLLEATGVTIRGVDRTGYDRLGTALADALALGLSGNRAAKLIRDSVSDPARALTIAITESNRAISRATIERYQNYGLEQMEWATSDPCDLCAQNDGVVVNVGQAFPSGNTQPPAHPNCRCALLPVVPDFDTPVDGIENIVPPVSEPDYLDLMPPKNADLPALEAFQETLDPGFTYNGATLTDEMKQALEAYKGSKYSPINQALRDPVGFMNSRPATFQDEIMGYVRNLDMAMNVAPKVRDPFISFRGITGPAAERLASLTPGSVFVDDGFVSTTIMRRVTEKFHSLMANDLNLIVEIVNTPSTKGVMLDRFTPGLNEYEWLIARGSRFEVLSNDGKVMRVKVLP